MEGFSKLSKEDKIKWLASTLPQAEESIELIQSFWHKDEQIQNVLDEISENTITNFTLPYGIAPNFMINGKTYHIPMVTEESSVVAAASAGAKFWASRGGFHSIVLSNIKTGQIHFIWKGNPEKLIAQFVLFIEPLKVSAKPLTLHMERRGGGILNIELLDLTEKIPDYFQLKVDFGTADSMGANFINSCLERMASELKQLISDNPGFIGQEKETDIIMSILSNYNPQCIVESWVECNVREMELPSLGLSAEDFVRKIKMAVNIAEIDIPRAVTHNKGILNGIDAVVIATGNDFRAIEAGAHAWASRNGRYSSLSKFDISSGILRFSISVPLALGTVGGLTNIHPLARLSMAIMGNPGAELLMQLISAAGLANHFSALRSLVTIGIQKGHMKMHLSNILVSLNANESERNMAVEHFTDKTVFYSEVRDFIENLRKQV
jgi:hydroxymethylglutaryl-CoA reductase